MDKKQKNFGRSGFREFPSDFDMKDMLMNDLMPFSHSEERRSVPRGRASERGRDPYNQDLRNPR